MTVSLKVAILTGVSNLQTFGSPKAICISLYEISLFKLIYGTVTDKCLLQGRYISDRCLPLNSNGYI